MVILERASMVSHIAYIVLKPLAMGIKEHPDTNGWCKGKIQHHHGWQWLKR